MKEGLVVIATHQGGPSCHGNPLSVVRGEKLLNLKQLHCGKYTVNFPVKMKAVQFNKSRGLGIKLFFNVVNF